MNETLTVIKVLFRKDNGWSILRTDQGVAKGVVGWAVQAGDRIEADGTWGVSAYNGDRELTFKSARISIPGDARALLTYAVSITKGLGPKREQEIWQKYGAGWQNVRELDIPGLSAAVDFHWQDTLARIEQQASQSQAIAFLLAKACTLNMANAAWERWLHDTIPLVSADCYRLAELPRYGFCHVDGDVRRAFGIEDGDPRRVQAAVLYILGAKVSDGSTLATIEKVSAGLIEVLGEFADPAPALEALTGQGRVRILGDKVALEGEYQWELTIAQRYHRVA